MISLRGMAGLKKSIQTESVYNEAYDCLAVVRYAGTHHYSITSIGMQAHILIMEHPENIKNC